MSEEMQVVYENQDDYCMSSGPHGYSKVGFRHKDRIFWVATCGSYMPNGAEYAAAEAFCKELVARWNAYKEQESA